MEATVVDGNGTETGHIIVTTIGGRNGQPKQVNTINLLLFTVNEYADRVELTICTYWDCRILGFVMPS